MPSPPDRPPARRRSLALVALAWLVALAAAITGLLVAASEVQAGSYRALQCAASAGAGDGDLSFRRTSDHYRAGSRCGSGDGLSVTHAARSTAPGRFGSWSLVIPDGIAMTRLRLAAAGHADDGHRPEVLAGPGETGLRSLGAAGGGFHELVWTQAGTRRLEARLRCARGGGCGEGEGAHVAVRGIAVDLKDSGRPDAELGGELTRRTGRAGEEVEVNGADAGSGLRRAFVEVNGEPVRSRLLDCRLHDGIAVRLRPCAHASSERFQLETEGAPFVQGPNVLRACVLDYADEDGANRACHDRRIRVDNLCPIAESVEGERLTARFAGGGRRATDRGEGARVRGRLVDGSGAGVAGAEICIATRPRADGFAEAVAATRLTGEDGRFAARLEAGPSREVRLAYWADSERVAEEVMSLRAPARPRLDLSPDRRLRNGERVRFAVRLPGPRLEDRLVVIQARGEGGWQRLRSGRTDAAGRYTAGYRFHATTSTRRYRFRALVPEQRGYPYERGRSPVRRATVVG